MVARGRLAQAMLLALAAVVVLAVPAAAGKKWCRADPIVRIDGNEVQIIVGVPEAYVKAVNGPIAVEIGVPAKVARELVSTDTGFNGYGEVVTFIDIAPGNPRKGIPVRLKVKVPIDERVARPSEVAIQVTITQDHSREVNVSGNAKQGVSVSFVLTDVLAIRP